MAETSKKPKPKRSARKPPATPEARENLMINLAEQLAEKQLRDGTASAQVVTHYLKLGSQREQLEREKLRQETKLLISKAEAIDNSEERAQLYEKAIQAMRGYAGTPPTEETE